MRWAGYVACIDAKGIYEGLVKNLNGGGSLGDQDIDERIILKWILVKMGGRIWIGFVWLRIRTCSGLLSTQY
jgi:hypothetical protein